MDDNELEYKKYRLGIIDSILRELFKLGGPFFKWGFIFLSIRELAGKYTLLNANIVAQLLELDSLTKMSLGLNGIFVLLFIVVYTIVIKRNNNTTFEATEEAVTTSAEGS